MASPEVSIVIVDYNAGKYLGTCISSLCHQTMKNFEIIVVDNNSSDKSMQILCGYPAIRSILNKENRGFAAAQNQGIAIAKGQYIMALNYDLTMIPTFLEELVRALGADPAAGWATGKLLNMTPEGKKLETIYSTGHIFVSDRFSFLRGNGETDIGQYDRPERIFGAPGAAAMYKREMICDISIKGKFFDEHLFTWYEDVDVDWRAMRAGWRCCYVPSAIAYHVGHIGEEYHEPYKSWRATYGIGNRWLIIAANDSLQGLRRDWKSLLRYELSSFIFVVRSRLLGAYLRAIWRVLKGVFYLKSKRKAQSAAKGPGSSGISNSDHGLCS